VTEPDDSLRVSDAERDQTLHVLGDHAAVGRLTLDELEERSSRALTAKTRGELATLTGDLPVESDLAQPAPAPGQPAPALAKKPVRWMVAIMSGSQRRGRFRAVGRINIIAFMGGDEIDLREAEIEDGGLTLNVVTVMGGATIYIPDSVELDVGGFSLMGANTEIGSDRPPRPGAPVIRLRGWHFMGGATIFRVPPQARGLGLKEARRLAKAAGKGKLPPPATTALG
jgi:hypothetical protein